MENSLTGIDYSSLYFYIFYLVITLVFVVELMIPKRALQQSFAVRWLNNIGLDVLAGYFLRFLVPIAGIDLALRIEVKEFGLLNFSSLPMLIKVIIGIFLLDLVAYISHRLYHRYLLLWRCHLVHHSDSSVDFTTHLRHHPFESLISLAINLAVIAMLGIPALAVFVYGLLAHVVSTFSHGNIVLSEQLDSFIRRFIITPDMHRVHHSVDKLETNSNYGIVFPWWDRLFNTYVAQPAKGHLDMKLGLDRFRDPRDLYIDRLLLQPFFKEPGQRVKPADDE